MECCAGMFSIMMDKARNGSTEQLTVCVCDVTEDGVKKCLLVMTELRELVQNA